MVLLFDSYTIKIQTSSFSSKNIELNEPVIYPLIKKATKIHRGGYKNCCTLMPEELKAGAESNPEGKVAAAPFSPKN